MKSSKARYSYPFRTSLGWFCLTATQKGLYALHFGRNAGSNTPTREIPADIYSLLRRSALRIGSYLKGKSKIREGFPIDWSGYRNFEKRVLRELTKIPQGQTRSYQFLAVRAGRPRAARYVGRIMGGNRLPIILPCHRILPKSGELGGFSQGLRWKKRLLKLECPSVDKQLRKGRPL